MDSPRCPQVREKDSHGHVDTEKHGFDHLMLQNGRKMLPWGSKKGQCLNQYCITVRDVMAMITLMKESIQLEGC